MRESISLTKSQAREGVRFLVDKYTAYQSSGKGNELNEAQTRNEFIEPLFGFLGWDMRNIQGGDDVTTEMTVSNGRVDLAFRVNGEAKFLLEAKAIRVNLESWDWAKQAINYSWNRAVNWAVLTDFQGLKIFNSEIPPKNLANNLFLELQWNEFLTRFEDLWLLSKQSCQTDALEKAAKNWKKSEKKTGVTIQLFENLTNWRDELSADLTAKTDLSQSDKDEAIQKLLDRLIFIRAAEDRKIITNRLMELSREERAEVVWGKLISIFHELDATFNSKLFASHPLEKLPFSPHTVRQILRELYENPDGYIYDFSAISGDLLGSIYERYLTFTQLPDSERTDKSKRKLRGIFYTPEKVVDYLLSNTIDKLIEGGRKPQSLKILDPACGSGSFLINAFDRLVRARNEDSSSDLLTLLDTATNNIYGIDIDEQATEIAKLNILLRCLQSSVQLPDISSNIVNANTLLTQSIYSVSGNLGDNLVEDTPFSLEKFFPEVSVQGGFDLIVGNPPYVFARDKSFSKTMKGYLTENYLVAQYQINTYALFIERSLQLLKPGGYLAFIVPNTWLTIQTHSSLRSLLAKSTSSLKIVNVYDKVFPDASVDVSLIVCEKGNGNDLQILELSDGNFLHKCSSDKSLLEAGAPISISALSNPISIGMMKKMDSLSTPLSDLADVNSGLKAYEVGKGEPKQTSEMMDSRLYHSDSKKSQSSRRYLEGKDVKRYRVAWSGSWLEYGRNLAAMRDPAIFEGPRILVRQIPSKPPFCIEASLTEEDYVHDINSNVIRPKREISLYALLAILNSATISFWFVHYFDKLQRKTFPQFKANELANFPIPKLSEFELIELDSLGRKLEIAHEEVAKLEPGFNSYKVLASRISEIENEIEKLLHNFFNFNSEEIDYLLTYSK